MNETQKLAVEQAQEMASVENEQTLAAALARIGVLVERVDALDRAIGLTTVSMNLRSEESEKIISQLASAVQSLCNAVSMCSVTDSRRAGEVEDSMGFVQDLLPIDVDDHAHGLAGLQHP